MRIAGFAICTILLWTAPAQAGETVLYQPAPEWVTGLPAEATAGQSGPQPTIQVFDVQQRIADGMLWEYVDRSMRIDTPEMLAQMSTVVLQWLPDKGDLIVHNVQIERGGEVRDLLAEDLKFDVLRREEALEQRQLTGQLSATSHVEGLRVGDVFRMRYSVTRKDDALGGNVQSVAPIIAKPVAIGYGRMRVIWPRSSDVNWQLLADGIDAEPVRRGGQYELAFDLPVEKQPEMPGDAPPRFRRPPLIEVSTFDGWGEVSAVMAPLYDVTGLITPDSPLAAEVARIRESAATPLERTQAALRLVQDEVRYLAVSMNGGNYVPQSPVQTWDVRYGDCKAKTLLLLALLDALDIKAEAVLANISLGDLVPQRLPSAAAFDHVLVRAEIDGQSLWLDGTGIGSRIEDIRDTPPFRHVLPVRTAGAQLLAIPTHANARPSLDLRVVADESSSADLPGVFDATITLRGGAAMSMSLAKGNLQPEQERELVQGVFARMLGESQFSNASLEVDSDGATAILKARGVRATQWTTQDKKRQRMLGRALSAFEFAPDRARAAWADIPVASANPESWTYSLKLRLPDNGEGYRLEGPDRINESVAGFHIVQSIALEDGVVTLEERLDATGAEIPASEIASEKDRFSTIKSLQPKIVAPEDATRRWTLDKAAKDATQLAAIEDIYEAAIKADPDEVAGLTSRASLRTGIGDHKGALRDLTRALEFVADADTYLARSAIHNSLGNLRAAAEDARKARDLDPASQAANRTLAYVLAEQGKMDEATELLDTRIALGGEDRDGYREAKASVIGEFGDAEEALALLNEMMADKPGNPQLLNQTCWIRGLRALGLDEGLKQCTRAIELSSRPYMALDSRSVVWFRMGRFEEALADLDAALGQMPSLAESRYMRGVVLSRLGRTAESREDLAIARLLDPSIDDTYGRYDIAP